MGRARLEAIAEEVVRRIIRFADLNSDVALRANQALRWSNAAGNVAVQDLELGRNAGGLLIRDPSDGGGGFLYGFRTFEVTLPNSGSSYEVPSGWVAGEYRQGLTATVVSGVTLSDPAATLEVGVTGDTDLFGDLGNDPGPEETLTPALWTADPTALLSVGQSVYFTVTGGHNFDATNTGTVRITCFYKTFTVPGSEAF